MSNFEFYLSSIKHELERLDKSFTGNITFRINLKDGSIGNMNVELGKSVKGETYAKQHVVT